VVLDEITQAGEKGVKNAVVLSAGFKEIGADGEKLQNELVKRAEKYQINLLGPNCLGFVNKNCPINATFGEPINETGNLRFITQSGAIAAGLFDWCNANQVGISQFITLGNKAGLNENDILHYFHQQAQNTLTNHNGSGLSHVEPIGLYLESISDGGEFLKLASEISKVNPVFIIKPGKTQAAAKAMQSHTGAIAGEDSVLDAVLKQAGVIRCETLEDFFELSRAFAWEDAPASPKVAVISNAGGPAVISADSVVKEGLQLAQFDEETKKKLMEKLPRSASIVNPVDILGDALADRFSDALEILLQNKEVDSLVVILTPQIMTQISQTAQTIGDLSKKYQKPILCSFIGGNLVAEGEKTLNDYKIPSFRYPERAISALAKMWQFKKGQQRPEEPETTETITLEDCSNSVREIIQRAVNEKQRALDNIAADNILKSVGINTPATQIANSFEEAKNFALENGFPVVLKLSSPGLLHKREIGGVITDIVDEHSLDDAWHKMERKLEQLEEKYRDKVQFQIQKGITNGIEVIVGIKHDPTFGAVLLFGAGGYYAELIADRNLYLLPINRQDAIDLVARSKAFKVLKGKDEQPDYALDKLYDLILRMSKLEMMIQEADQIEINPVIVTVNDVWAVDTKVVLKEFKKKPTAQPPKLRTARCLKHEVLATQFNFFQLETEEPFEFKAGQYISVKVGPETIRAYSIATRVDSKHFDLLVDTRPGGPGSKFFENLKEGDTVPFLGPFGVFTYREDDNCGEILLLATGSGMSALRCILDSALTEKKISKPIKLYFGLTYEKEIFWQDHFEDLKKKYKNFDYKIVICNPPDQNYDGCTGFITKYLAEDYPKAEQVSAYLCGHRAMIADATEILLKAGCPKERIYQERFV
jgi:acetyltransferase